jgi:hypothetical protein
VTELAETQEKERRNLDFVDFVTLRLDKGEDYFSESALYIDIKEHRPLYIGQEDRVRQSAN